MVINIRFYLLLLIIIGLLSAPDLHSASKKKSDAGPGVTIEDDAGLTVSQGLTDIIIDGNEIILQVPGNVSEVWNTLKKTLRRLGVPFFSKKLSSNGSPSTERFAHAFKTNWVSWNVDFVTGKGVSGSGLLDALKGKNRERHKFLFHVLSGAEKGTTFIQVVDAERQAEVDIAPDSIYSWLEWQKQPPQPEAAHTFLQRIQGVYELAMTSHLIVVPDIPKPNVLKKTPIVPVSPSTNPSTSVLKPKVLEPTAQASEVSDSASKEARAPETSQPIQRTSSQRKPKQSVAKENKKATLETISIHKSSVPKNAVSKATSNPKISESKKADSKMDSEPKKDKKQSDRGTLTATNALWIQKKNDETWDALLKTFEKFEISIQMKDPEQMILSTGWLNYFYDKKNQSLRRYPKDKPSWAFNLMGDGRERHRIQLTVLPTNQGAETLIYAFHTGSQELTDQTPDSSQTNLVWEGRETNANIASAFLRLLSTRLLVE